MAPPQSQSDPVLVSVAPVSFADVLAVARGGRGVAVAEAALTAIRDSRARIEELASDVRPHYGVSTGFGALASRHIPLAQRTQLQRSLIRSHAAGAGPEVETEVVRAMMLLRLSTLATGRTGVRPVVAETYAAMLSAHITFCMRSQSWAHALIPVRLGGPADEVVLAPVVLVGKPVPKKGL